MNINDPKEQLTILAAKRAALLKQRDAIDTQLDTNHRLTTIAKNMLAKALVAQMGDNIDWAFMLASENLEPGKALWDKRHEAIRDLGLLESGYWMEILQPQVMVMLTYDDPKSLAKTRAGIELLTKFFRPHEDGFVKYGVMEHTCSLQDSYEVAVLPDLSAAELRSIRYGRVIKAGTLDEVLAMVQEEYWYEGGPQRDQNNWY